MTRPLSVRLAAGSGGGMPADRPTGAGQLLVIAGWYSPVRHGSPASSTPGAGAAAPTPAPARAA
ncbi:MAG: hypothetical protein ACRD0W_13080, partial [Acidimicrobiales bacterium]